jgi:hypothetical protein
MRIVKTLKFLIASSTVSVGIASCLPAKAINIVINAGATLQGNAPALAAFNRAAANWNSRFTDNITVNIDANLVNLGSSTILGQASSVILEASFNTIRDRIVADANGIGDGIVTSLPTAAQFSANLPTGASLSGNLAANKSTLKALGFTGLDAIARTTTDATIEFNTGFNFDFDNRDGVTAETFDFESIALHELGHALGFLSAVDGIDEDLGDNGILNNTSITPYALDLFRFRDSTLPTGAANFASAVRELRPNQAASFTDTVSGAKGFSTGAFTGDRRQAGHWKDNALTGTLIGIMDPTFAPGSVWNISDADLQVYNLIGYDLAPVPFEFSPSVGIIGSGMIFGLNYLRKKRKSDNQGK